MPQAGADTASCGVDVGRLRNGVLRLADSARREIIVATFSTLLEEESRWGPYIERPRRNRCPKTP